MNTTAPTTADALNEITFNFAHSLKRRNVSPFGPFFPFGTMSDVRSANRHIGNHFFDRATMREFGTKIESALYAGTLFITSEKSWSGEGRHYTVRYVVPTGEVFTLEGASQLKTIDEARDIARNVAAKIREVKLHDNY